MGASKKKNKKPSNSPNVSNNKNNSNIRITDLDDVADLEGVAKYVEENMKKKNSTSEKSTPKNRNKQNPFTPQRSRNSEDGLAVSSSSSSSSASDEDFSFQNKNENRNSKNTKGKQNNQKITPKSSSNNLRNRKNKKQINEDDSDTDKMLDAMVKEVEASRAAHERAMANEFDELILGSSSKTSGLFSSNRLVDILIKCFCVLAVIGAICLVKFGEVSFTDMTDGTVVAGKDLYSILGLSPHASKAQIRKAYRSLSLKWHPDKVEGECLECAEKFRDISEAYKILSDPEARQIYDFTGYTRDGQRDAFKSNLGQHEVVLTAQVWQSHIQPSIEFPDSVSAVNPFETHKMSPTGVWLVLVADPVAEITEHLIPLWTEIGNQLHGLVGVARVSPDDSAMSLLGMKIRLTPAIILIRPGVPHEIYGPMSGFEMGKFMKWISDRYPVVVEKIGDKDVPVLIGEMSNNLEGKFSQSRDARPPILMVTKESELNLEYNAAVLRLSKAFRFFHTSNVGLVDTLTPIKSLGYKKGVLIGRGSNGLEIKPMVQVPSMRDRDRWGDLGLGTDSLNARAKVTEELREFSSTNYIPLEQRNIRRWCGSDNGVRTLCILTADGKAGPVTPKILSALEDKMAKLMGASNSDLEDYAEFEGDQESEDDLEVEDEESVNPEFKFYNTQIMSVRTNSIPFKRSELGRLWAEHFPNEKSLFFDADYFIIGSEPGNLMLMNNSGCSILAPKRASGKMASKVPRCLPVEQAGVLSSIYELISYYVVPF